MNQQNPEDESLDRLLSHLTAVELSDGFGQRLNQRISARSKPAGPARQPWPSWSLGFASLCGVLLMLAFGMHRNALSPAPRRGIASSPHFEAQPQPVEVVLGAEAASKHLAARRLASGHHRLFARGARPREAADAAELRSFPAPPLPLPGRRSCSHASPVPAIRGRWRC